MMKRLKYFLASLIALLYVLLPVLPVHADEPNLLANPSVETGTETPANWTASRWGTNAGTTTYENTGHTGSKSLRIELTSRTDGDAKWMADPVAVTPNTSYTYTNYYKSNISTEIDLQVLDASGTASYAYITTVPAAADWTPLTATFTTPANAAQVVVLHVVAQAGWLQTDDFSLTTTVLPPAPEGNNLIANPSFETANGATAAGWLTNNWGTNASNFVYESTGRTGTHSATANVTSLTNGDAKWYAEPVTVTPGKSYSYSDYYKSSAASRVVVAYTDAAGNFTYGELTSAPASADWTQYNTSFTAPATAAHASVFHLIDSVGFLTIDDVSLTESVVAPPGDQENLVPNPSMETVNGTTPASWLHGNWGANASNFVYENTGRTGSKSVTATITSFTDGDAKWFFDPVLVTGGKSYIYRDYYKSTVPTRVVAAYIDASGNYTFQELAGAAAAAGWTQYQASITIPATATRVTIFHLIDGAGTLTLDDALLQPAVPTSTSIDVPNGSVETGAANPTSWQSGSWGNNTASFQYVTNEGHTGNRSLKTTVSNFVDGDAKWFFDPITTLTPGTQYRFSAWYRGTVAPHAVALYILADGTEQYVGLPNALNISDTAWTQYSDTFTVPQNATAVSVFLLAADNGWLQTDDYAITTYHPNGFNRALLTLTFDDGHEDNVATALPVLNQYGFKTTQCYASSFLEGMPQAVLDNAKTFYNQGHEICSHTVTHPMLTTLDPTDLNFELQHSQQFLESWIGAPIHSFASPFGDYNAAVNDVIDNYYQSHRTVDEGFNSKDNFDVYRLRVQNILDTTTADQVAAWVAQAQADKTWLILVYHRVANDPGPYDSFVADFQAQMAAVAASGIQVSTEQAALSEILPQL